MGVAHVKQDKSYDKTSLSSRSQMVMAENAVRAIVTTKTLRIPRRSAVLPKRIPKTVALIPHSARRNPMLVCDSPYVVSKDFTRPGITPTPSIPKTSEAERVMVLLYVLATLIAAHPHG